MDKVIIGQGWLKYCGSQREGAAFPLIRIMENLDTVVTVIGTIYGILLILTVFVRTKFTEAFRIDALFISNPSETTRLLNLVAGILVAGYSIYSLLEG